MSSETLRQAHPDKVRPTMADGSLIDRGEDLGPGKDPKAVEIDARHAADTGAYRASVEKTREGGKDPSSVKIEALREAQKEAKSG